MEARSSNSEVPSAGAFAGSDTATKRSKDDGRWFDDWPAIVGRDGFVARQRRVAAWVVLRLAVPWVVHSDMWMGIGVFTCSRGTTDAINRVDREFGVAVLLVEHDMNMARGISDRVCALDFGRRTALGAPAEIARIPMSSTPTWVVPCE